MDKPPEIADVDERGSDETINHHKMMVVFDFSDVPGLKFIIQWEKETFYTPFKLFCSFLHKFQVIQVADCMSRKK